MIMKKIVALAALSALGIALFVAGCRKEVATADQLRVPQLPAIAYDYHTLPPSTPEAYNPFGAGFEVDDHKATLGRVLFYETRLSFNNRTSCGSCHLQARAFSDPSRVSIGFEDVFGGRNALSIVNAGSQTALFWDMREVTLREMVLKPIANHLEMGMDDPNYIVAKVSAQEYYPPLFQQAFGSPEITAERIAEALENFVRSMISVSSKFDKGKQNGFAEFTEKERLGMDLYFVKFPCSGCHGDDNLGGAPTSEMMNIGLDTLYKDHGVIGTIPGTDEPLNGWFKVPSLRNVMLTAPYMHDGRFATIDEVLEFYNSGIQAHMQLDHMLRMREDGGFHFLGPPIDVNALYPGWRRLPLRMHMTPEEKEALKAFMHTLTDPSYITDPKFSDPFVLVDVR